MGSILQRHRPQLSMKHDLEFHVDTWEIVGEILASADEIAAHFHNEKSDLETALRWYEILVKLATHYGNNHVKKFF